MRCAVLLVAVWLAGLSAAAPVQAATRGRRISIKALVKKLRPDRRAVTPSRAGEGSVKAVRPSRALSRDRAQVYRAMLANLDATLVMAYPDGRTTTPTARTRSEINAALRDVIEGASPSDLKRVALLLGAPGAQTRLRVSPHGGGDMLSISVKTRSGRNRQVVSVANIRNGERPPSLKIQWGEPRLSGSGAVPTARATDKALASRARARRPLSPERARIFRSIAGQVAALPDVDRSHPSRTLSQTQLSKEKRSEINAALHDTIAAASPSEIARMTAALASPNVSASVFDPGRGGHTLNVYTTSSGGARELAISMKMPYAAKPRLEVR